MNMKDPKFLRFSKLQGYLDKLSSNIIVGYQTRFWKVFDNGTKIGYSNKPQQEVKAENIFPVGECFASQASGNTIFEFQTKGRTFLLRAPNEEERIDWIKGITYLNKLVNTPTKIKPALTVTNSTVASKTEISKKKDNVNVNSKTSIKLQNSRIYLPQDLLPQNTTQFNFQQALLKYITKDQIKYFTLVTELKVKSEGIFKDSYKNFTYFLISSKSLYPDIYISDQNLTNLSLPPWIQINCLYRLIQTSGNPEQILKQNKKQVFHISKILDVQEGTDKTSVKVNTGQVIFQFFSHSVEQSLCFRRCLQIALDNALEVSSEGKVFKKNYDKLFQAYYSNKVDFQSQSKLILSRFLKEDQQFRYTTQKLMIFMDQSLIFLRQFIEIGQKKRKNVDDVIVEIVKIFHQQVKNQAKLTWDSSFLIIKGIDILNMLKKLSQYYQIMKKFIKSVQFLDGMKELSKIYVRESWKNFQSIIINIVQQQKKSNILEDEYCQFIQTHGVNDLFKFIYNVFQLAYPHWKNKIHLYNVARLMQRALEVFVNEIRSTIDEEFIAERQMIGLANNYFSFVDYVKQLYESRFSELGENTEEFCSRISNNYRDVSMIVLQKICKRIGQMVEQYCSKCTIQTIKAQSIRQILVPEVEIIVKVLHMAFINKLFQKLAKQVHFKICLLVADQVTQKKKLKLKQIIRCVKQLAASLNKVFIQVCKSDKIISRLMQDLQIILSFDLYSDIQRIINFSHQRLKNTYLKILKLRQDYTDGSPLSRILNDQNSEIGGKIQEEKKKKVDHLNRQKHLTLSKVYFQQEMMDSDQHDQDSRAGVQQNTHKNSNSKGSTQSKVISEGYLTKGKRNQKVWEKQYFRLKNGNLYIFESEYSQRCRNLIQVKNIVKIDVQKKQKPSFLLTYKNLGKQKEIKLKADSIQLRERWVHSINLEKKRILNEDQVKRKIVKYKEGIDSSPRKKYHMIIDYQELEKGRDYFSYSPQQFN